MKKLIIAIAALSTLVFSAGSCKKNDTSNYKSGIVTVKTVTDGSCQLQLDDKTALIPTNSDLKTNPYKKEVRAFVSYYDKGIVNYAGKEGVEYRSANVTTLDSILTKKPVPSVEDNDKAYGKDPIAIYDTWITVVEDGYITIHFCAPWGYTGATHTISLVKNTTSDPLCFELRHDAKGETLFIDYIRDGVVAFKISDILEKQKAPYEISVKYKNLTSESTVYFTYTPGESAHINNVDANDYE